MLDDSDDERCAALAQQGDERAFTVLVRRYQDGVYRLCLRYASSAEAEELAQEVFVKAFTGMVRFDPSRPFRPWFFTIARRTCLDFVKKRRPTLAAEVDVASLASESDDSPFDVVSSARDAQRVAEALRRLPEHQREALCLFHLEGFAYQEIADILNVPIGTVMTWLHRARARVKEQVNSTKGPNE